MEDWNSTLISPEAAFESGVGLYNNIATRIYYFVLVPVGFLSNLFVLIVAVCIIRHQRSQRSVPDIFLGSIATCDLLSIVALHLPSLVCFWESGWVLGDAGCKYQIFLQSLYFKMLFLLQTLQSVDRYNALVRPLWHHNQDIIKRVQLMVAGAASLGVAVSALNLGCSWHEATVLSTWFVCIHKLSTRSTVCLISTAISVLIYVTAFGIFISCNVLLFKILMKYYARSSTNVLSEISRAMTVLDHERKTNLLERPSLHVSLNKRASINVNRERVITPNSGMPDLNRSGDARKASQGIFQLGLPPGSRRSSSNQAAQQQQPPPVPEFTIPTVECEPAETEKLLIESNSTRNDSLTTTSLADTDISNPENFQDIPFIDVDAPEIQVTQEEEVPVMLIPDIEITPVIPEVNIIEPTDEETSTMYERERLNCRKASTYSSFNNRPDTLTLPALTVPVITLGTPSPKHSPRSPRRELYSRNMLNGNARRDTIRSNNFLAVPMPGKRPSGVGVPGHQAGIYDQSRSVSIVSRHSVAPNTWEFFYLHRQLTKLLKKLSKKADQERREVKMAKLMLLSAFLFVLLWIPYSVSTVNSLFSKIFGRLGCRVGALVH